MSKFKTAGELIKLLEKYDKNLFVTMVIDSGDNQTSAPITDMAISTRYSKAYGEMVTGVKLIFEHDWKK